jgi:hypothetical protein
LAYLFVIFSMVIGWSDILIIWGIAVPQCFESDPTLEYPIKPNEGMPSS